MRKLAQIITALVLLLSLAGVLLWQFFAAEKINFYIICVAVLLLSMLPFIIGFEVKKISAREITLVATLIALAVVSRAVFYLIPQFKPIAAVVVVSAVCLGAERGYVIGAFSAFISNFIFGQGYWTPFQMVALGLVGLLSGVIFKFVKPNRYTMSAVGFILSFVVYGLIVDTSSVLTMSAGEITLPGALVIYASGAPFSFIFGASTALFLFLFGDTFVKKINRINTKFNLVISKKK